MKFRSFVPGFVLCLALTMAVMPQSDPKLAEAVSAPDILAQIDQAMADEKKPGSAAGAGKWVFDFKPADDACSAAYLKDGVWVTLLKPGRAFQGAILMFSGGQLPMPSKYEKIKATLIQTASKPQTVNVGSLTTAVDAAGKTKVGTVFFQVPEMHALLMGIEDKHDFEIMINNRSVAKIGWTQGHLARKKLEQCMAGTVPSPDMVEEAFDNAMKPKTAKKPR